MPNIKVIQHNESEGELKEIYDNLVKTRGKLAEVHKIQSLNPKSIVNHIDLYMTIMFGNSPLKRYQREMMAVVVSKTNNCNYCINHHAEALNHFWKDDYKLEQLKENYKNTELSEKDMALCKYAEYLTLDPGLANIKDMTLPLKNVGFNDRAILDSSLVISYFNFVNRLVQSLGVTIEEDVGGYEYD